MFTDKRLVPVYEGQQYTAPDGTKYPHNFPRAEIPWLSPVTQIDPPDDPSLVVTGFTINKNNEQVWTTREKSDDEITQEKKADAAAAIEKSDRVALDCFKGGIDFPDDWKKYNDAAVAVSKDPASAEIPAQPDHPLEIDATEK